MKLAATWTTFLLLAMTATPPRGAAAGVAPPRDHTADRATDLSGVGLSRQRARLALVGWAATSDEARFSDRRRRLPPSPRLSPFGHTLLPGEEFRYDVYFAGNLTGTAEARVAARESHVQGPPVLRLEASARTAGVVALLAELSDDITTLVDAETGAPISSVSLIERHGLGSRYRHRKIDMRFSGRSHLFVVDTKDGKTRSLRRQLPVDTLDPLAVMAWVRALDLETGARARAHVADGRALLRVDIVSRGPDPLVPLPSLATALGITTSDVTLLEGTVRSVDRYDQVVPGRRVYALRAWLSHDGRRIPLAMESDMWLGRVRLVLAGYEPPARRARQPGSALADPR